MNEGTTRFNRSRAEVGVDRQEYKYDTRPSYSTPQYGSSRASRARSEGVITWHSGQHLDLLWNENTTPTTSNKDTRDLVSPPPLNSISIRREDQPLNLPTTITHNLHLKSTGEGREVLSPIPPKISREDQSNTPVWSASRARHRRSATRQSTTFNHTSDPPKATTATSSTIAPHASAASTNSTPIRTVSSKSITPRQKSMSTVDTPISGGQKDNYFPPLKRIPTHESLSSSDSLSDFGDFDNASPPSSSSSSTTTKLPQVFQRTSVWNDMDDVEQTPIFTNTTVSPSSSPPASTTSPTPATDESTLLSLSVLRHNHAHVSDTLSARLSLLHQTKHLISRNGGFPSGIPFALEFVLSLGDVTVLFDIAKSTFSLTDDGEDSGSDEREEMAMDDYLWVNAWLSAVQKMIESTRNTNHVLVGMKVLTIVIPTLEQWVDTAIGIARSLGPEAIPDELREQCYKYNETCKRLQEQIEGTEKKGRVGVANEVCLLLRNFIIKSLP